MRWGVHVHRETLRCLVRRRVLMCERSTVVGVAPWASSNGIDDDDDAIDDESESGEEHAKGATVVVEVGGGKVESAGESFLIKRFFVPLFGGVTVFCSVAKFRE